MWYLGSRQKLYKLNYRDVFRQTVFGHAAANKQRERF